MPPKRRATSASKAKAPAAANKRKTRSAQAPVPKKQKKQVEEEEEEEDEEEAVDEQVDTPFRFVFDLEHIDLVSLQEETTASSKSDIIKQLRAADANNAASKTHAPDKNIPGASSYEVSCQTSIRR